MKKNVTIAYFIKNNLPLIGTTIILWIIGLLFVGDGTAIKILGDEFGYWTAAAWITGKDWTDAASLISYYGYGYGFLLSFILRLPLNGFIEYKIAIVLNILMLNIVFFIIYYLMNDLHLFEKKYLSALIALTVTLYTGNTFHAQFTMSETIVMMLYWLLILLLYSLYKKYTFYKIVFASFILLYLYITHHRMLGVICAGVICLLYIQIKNKRYLHAFLFCLLTAGLMLGSEYIKDIYQNGYLVSEHTDLQHYNDYSGQVSSVKYSFSLKGFPLFITGVLGKIFYILSSTYLLAGFAVSAIFKNIYKYIKEKQLPITGLLELFIIMSVAASIAISTIYLLLYEARFDFLIYGRYNEFFICSLALIGLISLIKTKRLNIKEFLFWIITYVLLTVIVQMKLPWGDAKNCTFINSVGIYDTLSLYNNNISMVATKAILVFLFVILFFYYLKKQEKTTFILYACILLSVCWTTSYVYNYSFGTLSWASIFDQRERDLIAFIEEADCTDNLYYYAAEGRNICQLQFLMEDTPLKCIYTIEQLEALPENAYILTEEYSELISNGTFDNYKQIMQSSRLRLWIQNTNRR